MKKSTILFLVTLLSFLGLATTLHAKNQANTLIIHYYRYDNNYQDFNVWLWQNEPIGLDGIQFNFSNDNVDDYGAWLEVDLKKDFPNTTRFGIIIKKGGWNGYQEPFGDRYFELNKMEIKNNKVHAYLVEQDKQIGLSESDLLNNIPNYNPRILTAFFDKDLNIISTFTETNVQYEIFEISNKIEYLITSGTLKVTSLKFKIPNQINLLNSYKIVAKFSDGTTSSKNISIQNLYDTKAFEDAFTYEDELGAIYSKSKTIFRLWAPISESVSLNLYQQGHPNYDNLGNPKNEILPYLTKDMIKIENGVWQITIDEDLANTYYTFTVNNYGIENEVTDPYSYSTGANGLRSMVIDFNETNPIDWKYNSRPDTIKQLTDYIIYELHVRDLTTHSSWNGKNEHRGKFLGFTDTNTTYTKDNVTVTTGIDHIEELGVNAVQLLPIFDFGYIDEVEMANNPNYQNTFNWGYMPHHFNTLEGSYSTNPFDGKNRVNEFKQLVQALHDKNIRVIMDVVYNHTGESESSNFNKIIPGYFHRMNQEGSFINGSGTGNETASERLMVRKFMLDSIKFLATEYNLSGFRFDLMALHDVETMQMIEEMLHEIDPSIAVYGEPWHAGNAGILDQDSAGKQNIKNFNNVGAFNDVLRDAVKGSVFIESEGGFIQGYKPSEQLEKIKYGIVGGIDHKQVNIEKWHLSPLRTINYVSAHDNNTLYDKLRLTGISGSKVENLQIQANAIVLTSQGIPFLHAGVEFLRSKPKEGGGYDENSYESSDTVNQLRYDRKVTYNNVFEYYKTLIQIRKHYPQFKMTTSNDINNYLNFIETNVNTIAFEISNPNMSSMIVIHSGNVTGLSSVNLPANKTYKLLTSFGQANILGLSIVSNTAHIPPNTTAILVENNPINDVSLKNKTVSINKNTPFDPLANLNYDKSKYSVYSSSFYDTKISSNYLIKLIINDSNGNFLPLEYTLTVKGNNPKINIIGEILK